MKNVKNQIFLNGFTAMKNVKNQIFLISVSYGEEEMVEITQKVN